MTRSLEKLGKQSIHQYRDEGQPLDRLEEMARLTASDGSAGAFTQIGRATAMVVTLVGGTVIAASFLAPGLALAGSLATDGTGAHPWIADGGPEVAANLPWRIEVTLEYLAVGACALFIALRFGKVWLTKLQDWYDADVPVSSVLADELEIEPIPLATQFPQPVRHPYRPRVDRPRGARSTARNDNHELHVA